MYRRIIYWKGSKAKQANVPISFRCDFLIVNFVQLFLV